MTEANSGQPNTPEQQPVEANPDEPTTREQNQTDSSHNGPSSGARGPAKSGQRRSNEFWLALAGIAATLIVGITGSWLTYLTSTHQVQAESDRAALSFSREQRKNAYADFLHALSSLENEEYKLYMAFTNPRFRIEAAEHQRDVQNNAFSQFSDASSTVRLLASGDVANAREAIRLKQRDIQNTIGQLMDGLTPENAAGQGTELRNHLDLKSDLECNFVESAQTDLGLARNCLRN